MMAEPIRKRCRWFRVPSYTVTSVYMSNTRLHVYILIHSAEKFSVKNRTLEKM